MIKYFFLILAFVFIWNCKPKTDNKTQTEISKKGELKPPFRNQGEKENHDAQELFKKERSEKVYEKFIDSILNVDQNIYQYKSTFLDLENIEPHLKTIFTSGLLYPELIEKNHDRILNFGGISRLMNSVQKTPVEIEKDSIQFIKLIENSRDTLRISNVRELDFLNDRNTKRFRFWLWREFMANPEVFYFELKNTKAKDGMDTSSFILNAKVTFLEGGMTVL